MKNTYTFYTDPGHGWLCVPRSDLEILGLSEEISHCSYQEGDLVYLEEDSDAMKFLWAFKKKNGRFPLPIAEEHDKYGSFIRHFESYKEDTK